MTITTDRGSVRRYIPARNAPVRVSVAPGTTLHLKITIDATRKNSKPVHPPQGAGITEVSIPGIAVQPAMQLPTDELATFSGAARAQPMLSISDPVTNPNLDFTGPIATVEPAARKFVLPKAMSATVSGTAVPTPSARLEELLKTLTPPNHQAVQISASSWLRALPKFRPDNLLEKSSTPWIAGLSDRSPSITLHWNGNRAVSSISLGLSREASSPTEVTVTSPAGTRRAAVPKGGGIVSFTPMTTDTLTIRFTAVSTRFSAVPTGPQTVGLPAPPKIPLPVGLSSLGVPALGSLDASSPSLSTKVALACGTGPVVQIDNTSVPTQVTGTLGNLINLQPMDIGTCAPRTTTLGGWSPRDFLSTGKCVPSHEFARPSTATFFHSEEQHAQSPRTVVDGGKTNAKPRGRNCHVHSGRPELQRRLGGDSQRSHLEANKPERLGTGLDGSGRSVRNHDHELRA